jgi:hypothetical protein
MTPPAAAASAVQPRPSFAPGRPRTVAPRPRRVSGPARRPAQARPARRSAARQAGLALGVLEALGRLAQHRLLDRLIRGRIWIGLVAFALIGIVTLQLGLLKLNAGIGLALQRQAALQRENAALSIENSELAAGNLIEASAVRLGMEMVPMGSLRFLSAHPRTDTARGAAALGTPVASSTSASGEPAGGATTSTSSSAAQSGEGEGATSQSSASAGTAKSGGSEAEEAKTQPSESSPQPAATEAGGEPSSSTGASAASGAASGAGAGSSAGGSAEVSGGTQPASSGK